MDDMKTWGLNGLTWLGMFIITAFAVGMIFTLFSESGATGNMYYVVLLSFIVWAASMVICFQNHVFDVTVPSLQAWVLQSELSEFRGVLRQGFHPKVLWHNVEPAGKVDLRREIFVTSGSDPLNGKVEAEIYPTQDGVMLEGYYQFTLQVGREQDGEVVATDDDILRFTRVKDEKVIVDSFEGRVTQWLSERFAGAEAMTILTSKSTISADLRTIVLAGEGTSELERQYGVSVKNAEFVNASFDAETKKARAQVALAQYGKEAIDELFGKNTDVSKLTPAQFDQLFVFMKVANKTIEQFDVHITAPDLRNMRNISMGILPGGGGRPNRGNNKPQKGGDK